MEKNYIITYYENDRLDNLKNIECDTFEEALHEFLKYKDSGELLLAVKLIKNFKVAFSCRCDNQR